MDKNNRNRLSSLSILPADLKNAQTFPVRERATKVRTSDFASIIEGPPSFANYINSLPHILKAEELRAIVDAIVSAYRIGKPVIAGIGGHVVKCGLSTLLIHLMEKGILSGIMMNGGASIHDFEIALQGHTSEDV